MFIPHVRFAGDAPKALVEFAAVDPGIKVHVLRGDGTHHLGVNGLEASLGASMLALVGGWRWL